VEDHLRVGGYGSSSALECVADLAPGLRGSGPIPRTRGFRKIVRARRFESGKRRAPWAGNAVAKESPGVEDRLPAMQADRIPAAFRFASGST
jgi:hypothetical protein